MNQSFSIDYRADEAAASGRVLNRALYGGRRWMPAMGIIVPAALFVVFVLHANWTAWMGKWTTTAIVGVGVVVLLYIRFMAPRINRRLFARTSGVARLEGRPVAYEFTDQGFHIRTEFFEGFQKWAGVDRIIDDGRMLLIVLGSNANFLPARLFESKEHRKAFVAWLFERLTPEAQARSSVK
jgi:YcxB-like protein